jgi:hypothetical protein
MVADTTLRQGSVAWFEMVGALLCDAALTSGLSPQGDVSLVERYIDGALLSDGLVQGFRFAVSGGKPSFRVGANADEQADITVLISAAAARTLNLLYNADPQYPEAFANFQRAGDIDVVGDITMLGAMLTSIHDAIVDRTA